MRKVDIIELSMQEEKETTVLCWLSYITFLHRTLHNMNDDDNMNDDHWGKNLKGDLAYYMQYYMGIPG